MSKWRQVALRDIATDIKDGTHGTHARIETGVPFLSAKNISASGKVVWDDEDEAISETEYQFITSSFSPKSGDLLVTVVGTLGRTAIFDGAKVAFQRSVAFVRPNKEVLPEYLFHASAALEFCRQLKRRSNATAQAGLYLGELAKIRIPLPPPSHQRRIAEILSTLDDAIEQTEALIAKHQQIKAGLMHDLFTRGVTPDGHLRPTREQAPGLYKESPLGWIPKEWDTKQIHQLGKVKGGKRVPAGTPFASAPTPYPYLRVTDMVDGWIDDTAPEYVDVATERLITNYKIFRDDIYVTIAGTLGQFGRIPEHLSGAQLTENAARITEIDKMMVDLDFLCSVLRSDLLTEQKFASIGIGAGVPKLALYQIERFRIPIPDIDEQRAIQTPLTALQAAIKESAIVLEKLRQQKQGLMHDLLTGRVRVPVAETEKGGTS